MPMHLIWKRPDGFQNAQPSDFRCISLSNGAQLWLHRHEQEWYPFQVGGDWSGQADTKRLNKLINMLDASQAAWRSFFEHVEDDNLEKKDAVSLAQVAGEYIEWLEKVSISIKGTKWEVEIIQCALKDIAAKIRVFMD